MTQQGAAFVRVVMTSGGIELARPDPTHCLLLRPAQQQGLARRARREPVPAAFVSAPGLGRDSVRCLLGQNGRAAGDHRLAPLCHQTVTLALHKPSDDYGSACFLADIASIANMKTLYSRDVQDMTSPHGPLRKLNLVAPLARGKTTTTAAAVPRHARPLVNRRSHHTLHPETPKRSMRLQVLAARTGFHSVSKPAAAHILPFAKMPRSILRHRAMRDRHPDSGLCA